MAMLVVLLEADEHELVSLGSHAVSSLARLGVTTVALLRDAETVCVVLEGWAFDPAESAGDAVASVSPEARSARTLHPVMHMAVHGVSSDG